MYTLVIPMIIEESCCVATNDDRFAFVLGGHLYDGGNCQYNQKYDVLIYYVEKKKLRKSKIKLPKRMNNKLAAIAVMMDTELLVRGYIRLLKEIPINIIYLINHFR